MTDTNPMTGIKIEYHILQSFPVTCLNRDDVGAPKTAIVGGVTRARVSSQCWKRQVRLTMKNLGVKLAVRTKHIDQVVATACKLSGASEVQAENCGQKIAKFLAKDTLFFFSESEAQALATYAKENDFDDKKLKAKDTAKVLKKNLKPSVNGLDIALFGRMAAQAAELNIEAASSFSHAISTHRVSNELDFFTAIDDLQEEPGSSHMGSLEFNSATYYRYVSLDLGQLWDTLHGEGLEEAVDAFSKALFMAVPTARQTTQAGLCPWDFARIYVRRGQRLQYSLDRPVKSKGQGYVEPSIEALTTWLDNQEKFHGSLFQKMASYEYGVSTDFTIDNLVESLKSCIKGI